MTLFAGSVELRTERLLLRRWRPEDLAPFAALNADPETMKYFPSVLSRNESDEAAKRIEEAFERLGFGVWAAEVIGGPKFIGFVGLNRPTWAAPVSPCVEIGWRIARQHWGKGYATEAATGTLQHAFADLRLSEVLAWTTRKNRRSFLLMERLGMRREESLDFDHPKIAEGHPLRPHIVYRITRTDWSKRHPAAEANHAPRPAPKP